MVRDAKSGDGAWSTVHNLGLAALAPPRLRARALDSAAAPPDATMLADGSLAADPVGGSRRRAGGRWLLWPLPAFSQAYADGDAAALKRSEVRGASVTGLGGAVTFDSVVALQVPPGGAPRQITVTVISQQPGSDAGNPRMTPKLEMSYGMSVVDLQSGKWYVKEIGVSTEAVGAR